MRKTIAEFCDELIAAGRRPGGSVTGWEPFISRNAVEAELKSRGYGLDHEGGAPFRGERRTFFAYQIEDHKSWGQP